MNAHPYQGIRDVQKTLTPFMVTQLLCKRASWHLPWNLLSPELYLDGGGVGSQIHTGVGVGRTRVGCGVGVGRDGV